MMMVPTVLLFFLGICVGSFVNVCIYRIPQGKSVVSPASHCPACLHRLGLLELIPVFSYLYLCGRCRWCGSRFSMQYPLVELITGLLFVLVWRRFELSWSTLAGWVLVSILVMVTFIDINYKIIPNRIIVTGLLLGFPVIVLQSLGALQSGVTGFLAAGTFMLLVAVVSRGGMGGGDIKLAALMGLYLGVKGVGLALFLAFLAGGVVSMILLATGLKGRKDAIPFGPYLAMGGVLSLLWGSDLVDWYFNLWSI